MSAVVLAALIGATGGVAGGVFAALAAVRSGQVAARAPLPAKIQELRLATAELMDSVKAAPLDRARYGTAVKSFEIAWSDFSTHQSILVPSRAVTGLSEIVLKAARDRKTDPAALTEIAGQSLGAVVRMIGAHSQCLTKFGARWEERHIVSEWLGTKGAQIMSRELREAIRELVRGP